MPIPAAKVRKIHHWAFPIQLHYSILCLVNAHGFRAVNVAFSTLHFMGSEVRSRTSNQES